MSQIAVASVAEGIFAEQYYKPFVAITKREIDTNRRNFASTDVLK